MGAGSLAEAIIAGIVKAEIVNRGDIYVTNRSKKERLDYIRETYQVKCTEDKAEMFSGADIIILAVKPKDAVAALHALKEYVHGGQLIISVIAGLSTETMEKVLGEDIPVVRTMPNTSALIGQSATALAPGSNAEDTHLEIADELFQTVGMTKIVKESDIHTVTAISGSGPAFIYYFVEAMENAAEEFGLDKKTAGELIAQAVIGAGRMLQESGETSAVLRKNITSPGGTTQAGLEDLDRHQFQEMVKSCIRHARDRSIELGNSN